MSKKKHPVIKIFIGGADEKTKDKRHAAAYLRAVRLTKELDIEDIMLEEVYEPPPEGAEEGFLVVEE